MYVHMAAGGVAGLGREVLKLIAVALDAGSPPARLQKVAVGRAMGGMASSAATALPGGYMREDPRSHEAWMTAGAGLFLVLLAFLLVAVGVMAVDAVDLAAGEGAQGQDLFLSDRMMRTLVEGTLDSFVAGDTQGIGMIHE
jgi:hypothetical protein